MLDDRPYMRGTSFRQAYPLTFQLLILNTAIFVLQLLVGLVKTSGPGLITTYFALSLDGLRHGFVWQFLTFQFLHGGMFHLLVNLVGLYFFGQAIEEALGRKRFLVLYLVSGAIGGVFQCLLSLVTHSTGGVVGASAGVFGLVSAFATLFPDRRLTLLVFFVIPISMRARTLIWLSIGVALLGLLSPGESVAHGAHLGGIFAGWALVRSRIFREGVPFQWPAFRLPSRRPRVLARHGAPARSGWGGEPPPEDALDEHEFISREVDPILDKISAHGLQSLSERERRILEAARRRMRH